MHHWLDQWSYSTLSPVSTEMGDHVEGICHLGMLPAIKANSSSYPLWSGNRPRGCGWKGNNGSVIALAVMSHKLRDKSTYRLSGLRNGDEHLAYTPLWRWHLLVTSCQIKSWLSSLPPYPAGSRLPLLCWDRCYCKLGEWYEGLHGINETSIPQIIEYYADATKHDSTWYKAWHLFAYLNYEAVLFYKQQRFIAADAGTSSGESGASRSDDLPAEVSWNCTDLKISPGKLSHLGCGAIRIWHSTFSFQRL